jgi:predicted dehydrogenase
MPEPVHPLHPLGVAIIGAGLIGKKRALAMHDASGAALFHLLWIVDQDLPRSEALASQFPPSRATSALDDVLKDPAVQAVFIATRHDTLAELTERALRAGKHVLVEKPAARSAAELRPVVHLAQELALRTGQVVRVGYNHRFHPAMGQAAELVHSGALGPMMFLRGRYGHGGRLGYEKEWRADPELSGGGELIDQGVHLIDLARWYLGDFTKVHGTVKTLFWKMKVDDNAFFELETAAGQIAWLHASCTEWKNLFSLELYGRDAKILIEGLGGSYGAEKLTFYRMKPEMGPPEIEVYEYPSGDSSWRAEMSAFHQDILLKRIPSPSLVDAWAVLSVVDSIYKENNCSWVTKID